jgi:mono/diheme cytochrome c family protein
MKHLKIIVLSVLTYIFVACGSGGDKPADGIDRGVGPIQSLKVSPAVDMTLAAEGEKLFVSKCSACHKLDVKYVGPPLRDVTKRRSPEWIMNMILNPDKMTKENETAKELLGKYMTQMTNQNVAQNDARALLEYLRSVIK